MGSKREGEGGCSVEDLRVHLPSLDNDVALGARRFFGLGVVTLVAVADAEGALGGDDSGRAGLYNEEIRGDGPVLHSIPSSALSQCAWMEGAICGIFAYHGGRESGGEVEKVRVYAAGLNDA